MPAHPNRSEKKRSTRGAVRPAGRGTRRGSERTADPLDVPDPVLGNNPRDLSRAVRRSQERTGFVSTGEVRGGRAKGRRIAKHAASKVRRSTQADTQSRVRDELAAAPEIERRSRRERLRAPAAETKKGGPGKRRPYPKKTAAR